MVLQIQKRQCNWAARALEANAMKVVLMVEDVVEIALVPHHEAVARVLAFGLPRLQELLHDPWRVKVVIGARLKVTSALRCGNLFWIHRMVLLNRVLRELAASGEL